jgi:hypothetical protein
MGDQAFNNPNPDPGDHAEAGHDKSQREDLRSVLSNTGRGVAVAPRARRDELKRAKAAVIY